MKSWKSAKVLLVITGIYAVISYLVFLAVKLDGVHDHFYGLGYGSWAILIVIIGIVLWGWIDSIFFRGSSPPFDPTDNDNNRGGH